MRAPIIASSLLAAAGSGPPQRDVLLPPYAEKGCWARFYEKTDFGLPMRQIEGPTFVEATQGAVLVVPDMEEAGVQPLFAEARSFMLGPNARLIGYTGTLFRGQATAIGPGTLVRDAAAAPRARPDQRGAIARQVAELHRGRIELGPGLGGRGLRARFTMPGS